MGAAVEEYVHWRLVSDPRSAQWFGFRVSPVVAEQDSMVTPEGDVLPFATFRTISVTRETVLDLSGADSPTIQVAVDAYAGSYEAAKAAAAAVRAVLHKATESAFGTTLLVSLHRTEQDDIAIPVNGKEVPIYSVTQTFEILFED
jgi:hypothetical protein